MATAGDKKKTGLVLTGGGARAAYQVGVLKAVCRFLPATHNPFHIISGTSAGAINAATLAINAADFHRGVRRLNMVWRNFQVHHVFRADTLGLLKTGMHWMAALMFGGLGRYNPQSLLDREPLLNLLREHLDCSQIQQSIDDGFLEALSITASGYSSGQSVSFFQGLPHYKAWHRVRRHGVAAEIGIDHLMASSAIPFLFKAERINREYFGDGSMRQIAPMSAALHLGSDRLLVIGVNNERLPEERKAVASYPSLAKIAGHVLNSIFLDSLDADVERLHRINQTLARANKGRLTRAKIGLRHVDALVISPSEDLGAIANKYIHRLPRPLRLLLRGVGAINSDDSSFISYLMFDRNFCRELISLGYADAMQRKEDLQGFLEHRARE
jgi:NTE family protein